MERINVTICYKNIPRNSIIAKALQYIGISNYCDIKIVMVLYYSKYGALSNIEIPTIPKYTVNRLRNRTNLAKQRLHFCARCKLRVFAVSFVVKH